MKPLTFQRAGGTASRLQIVPVPMPTIGTQTAIMVDIVLPREALDENDSMKEEYEPLVEQWKNVFRLTYHKEALDRFFEAKQELTSTSSGGISEGSLPEMNNDEKFYVLSHEESLSKAKHYLQARKIKVSRDDLIVAQGYTVAFCDSLEPQESSK
jgi:hypothetical protein